MDRWLMRLSDRVVALSDTHARYLCEEEGVDSRRLAVIPNGVDPTRFRARPEAGVKREEGRRALGLPAEGLMLIVVAALRPEKNHEMLLRALAQLSIVPPPHLLVVGDGDLGTTLRRSADELGLSRRIHWFGWRDDIPELLAIADCLVLPSDPNVETFPMCVLEAMAASLPVVATDVGSLREMVEVGRTGTLVPPGQPQSLAQALEEILRDPMRRERMGAAGRARVTEHFHRRTMVSRTAALIRGVVAERRRVG